jgi:putative addiction module component (TIGR02574 family)
MTLRDLREAALQLEPKQRAELAESLLESLDELSKTEVEALWLDEAERRSREWDEGTIRGVPADELFRELKAR